MAMGAKASSGIRATPSRRLMLLNAVLQRAVKPRLAKTPTPQIARADFARIARHTFRRPPFLLRRIQPATATLPPLHWVTAGMPQRPGVLLYIHGGAYFAGSPETHEALAGRLSQLTGLEVVLPSYRLAPEHPAPTAYDDISAAHAHLIHLGYRSDEILVAGDSAGGGLALALVASLCASNLKPAAVAAFSPWVDLALGSASLHTNADADPLLPVSRVSEVIDYVLGTPKEALSPNDPRLSPVHATFDAPPPTLLQVGDTEILRDDALRMAARLRAFGGNVQLSQYAQAPHVWHLLDGYIPEARTALREAAVFLTSHLPAASPESHE